MKKFDFISKYKIWVIAVIVLLLVGTIITSVCGFNKSYEMGGGYELNVSVSEVLGNTDQTLQSETDKFFGENGLKPIDKIVIDNGQKFVYVFKSAVSQDVATALKARLQASVLSTLEVEVSTAITATNFDASKVWYGLLITSCAAILATAYVFFRYKFAAAATLFSSYVLNLLLTISLLAILRIPLTKAFAAVVLCSTLLTMAFNVLFFGQTKDKIKSMGDNSYKNEDIANDLLNKNLLPIATLLSLAIVVGLVMVIFGSVLVKYLGTQIMFATVVSCFMHLCVSSGIWVLAKTYADKRKKKSNKKPKSKQKETVSVEEN